MKVCRQSLTTPQNWHIKYFRDVFSCLIPSSNQKPANVLMLDAIRCVWVMYACYGFGSVARGTYFIPSYSLYSGGLEKTSRKNLPFPTSRVEAVIKMGSSRSWRVTVWQICQTIYVKQQTRCNIPVPKLRQQIGPSTRGRPEDESRAEANEVVRLNELEAWRTSVINATYRNNQCTIAANQRGIHPSQHLSALTLLHKP